MRLLIAICIVLVSTVTMVAQFPTIHAFDGDDNGDRMGWSVRGAGDVDADGVPDFVVGAPRDDNNGSSSGMARVYSGFDGTVLHSFDGPMSGDQLGYSVSGAGDVDNDGFDDIVAGAPFADPGGSSSGLARVFSGCDGSVLYTFNGVSASDQFGLSVGGAGDVNNDGFDDVIVGAPQTILGVGGYVRVFSGCDGSMLHDISMAMNAGFGGAVDGVGDVNGDGRDDFIVGGSIEAGRGKARVYSGVNGAVIWTFCGDSLSDNFGISVAGVGDVNGDMIPDVIVGATGDDDTGSNAGSARIFSGASGMALNTFFGDGADDEFGFSVDGAGDVNGDGIPDVVVGAWQDDDNGSGSGSARLLSVLSGLVITTVFGDGSGDNLGRSVGGVGDVNGDGFSDVVLGAPLDDNNGSSSGTATVRAFCGASPYGSATGTQAFNQFWLPGTSPITTGTVAASGATPFFPGFVIVSIAPDDFTFASLTILVNTAPTSVFTDGGFNYDANGEVFFPVDLQVPAIAGISLFLQMFELAGFGSASNGLQLTFCR